MSIFHNCQNYNFYPPLKKQIIINNFKVKVIELELFKFVRVAVALFDSDGNFVEQKFYTLENEDYLNWSNDDTYICNFVKRQLKGQYENDLSLKVVSNMKALIKEKQ
jgi:hypothetical protein